MIETNDSSSHALDGVDPDSPRPKRSRTHPAAAAICDDYEALKSLSEADKAHYASTPGGSRHTSISRGR